MASSMHYITVTNSIDCVPNTRHSKPRNLLKSLPLQYITELAAVKLLYKDIMHIILLHIEAVS